MVALSINFLSAELMRLSGLIVIVLFLAGCGSLERLKAKAPEANDFPTSLASEYLGFAQSEAEQGYVSSAEHFASKGLKALKGADVQPEIPDETLPQDARDALVPARAELMAVLVDDSKRVVPQAAARAQVMYDCMCVQAREERKPNDPSLCAEEFLAGLSELQKVVTTMAVGQGESRFITFEPGSALLEDKQRAIIRGINEYAAGTKRYVIALEGRSDGAKSKNLFLKRVAAIRSAFAELGTNPKRIRIESGASAKAVHLSRSEAVTDRNVVKVSVRILHSAKPKKQE
jgi:OmpA-OmpF porin, OOP family